MFIPIFFLAISVAYFFNGVWEYCMFHAVNWDYVIISVSFAVMAIMTSHGKI